VTLRTRATLPGFRLRTLVFCSAIMLWSQPPAPQDPAVVKRRLAEVQTRLAQVDQQLGALKKRRKGVLVELQSISLQADRARAQADGARLKRDQTEAEVHLISLQKEGIQEEIQRLRTELRKQVRWMQALGPWGGLSFFPTMSGFQEYLVQGRYLEYWRDQERRKLDLVQRLQGDLLKREKELQEAVQRLAQEEKETATLQVSLKMNEDRLQVFLDDLSQDESRQKDVQAELAEEAIQLERMLTTLLGKTRTDSFESAILFANLRGELPRPTEGSLAQAFGEQIHPKFHTRTVQSGLLIATEAGAQVQAVAEGRVVFADVYQSYGPMVILDHGSGFFSLYTHLNLFTVSKGQILKAGETIGSAGDTLEGPRIGFEIRHMALPQDPQKWLKVKYR
jgi:murein hydrolase activator